MTRDPARTQALAETALNQIKARGLPADPESYTLWYAYAARTKPELNNEIDQFTADSAASVSEFDRLYDKYLSPSRLLEHVDQIGSSVLFEQIDHGHRPEFGWDSFGAISGNLKVSSQAARSIG